MKNFYLICGAFLAFLLTGLMPAVAQTPAFAWARVASAPIQNFGKAIATDAAGNSYVTGNFEGTATFGSTTLTSSGGQDVFIAKYNPSGTVAWALKGGGASFDTGESIAVDGNGNSYVTGTFWGSATFGTTTLTSAGNQNMFIIKFSASGAVIWAERVGATIGIESFDMDVDGNGNSYITGGLRGTAVFGNTTLSSSLGSYDMFTVKYDASGTVVWAVKGGGTDTDIGFGIAVDGSGSSYVTGSFEETANFGTSTLTSSGASDLFTVKYDALGAVVWVVQGGGVGTDSGNGISVDNNGNSYVIGYFLGTAAFGTTPLTSNGNYDMFTVKYDPSGTVVWAVNGGGSGWDSGEGIAVDGNGNSYVTGYFLGTATFGTTTLTGTGNRDVFIVKYNALGAALWAVKAGGFNNDYGTGIALDGSGNSYIIGNFSGTANFGAILLNAAGFTNMFIAKLGSGSTTGVNAKSLPATAIISPNPNNGIFNLEIKGFRQNEATITAYDVTGKQVLSKPVTAVNGAIAENLQLPEQKGIYLLKVVAGSQVLTRKIIVE